MLVCHTCDNTSCCNPNHLFIGTVKDNIDDMVKKGRNYKPIGEKNPQAKLTINQVKEIRYKHTTLKIRQNKLAIEYQVSNQEICDIVNNDRWRGV
jgi:CRISPR/Cas system CMR-associated protein Cmr5 small subunit